MSGSIFSGDKIPENSPEETKGLSGPMGELGAPGMRFVPTSKTNDYMKLLDYLTKKYDVDREEILIGFAGVPPTDQTCLVYVRMWPMGFEEHFRKNGKASGRWVCWNRLMEKITDNQSLKGTYDFRKSIMYRR